jgi:hypothetical protein
MSVVPKTTGLETTVPLREFFSSIEGSAQIGRWEDSDKIRIAVLKFTGAVKIFYNRCPELHAEDVTWDAFKNAFSKRFRDVHSDLLWELRMALSRRKKKPMVPAGGRSTTSGGEPRAAQRPPSLLAGKRKANELANSGDSPEPATRRPAPGPGSALLPGILPATGKLAAVGSQQLGPPERGATYASVLVGHVAPLQASGSLKPTAMGSDLCDSAA